MLGSHLACRLARRAHGAAVDDVQAAVVAAVDTGHNQVKHHVLGDGGLGGLRGRGAQAAAGAGTGRGSNVKSPQVVTGLHQPLGVVAVLALPDCDEVCTVVSIPFGAASEDGTARPGWFMHPRTRQGHVTFVTSRC